MTLAALWALITSKFATFKLIIYGIILVAVLGLAWYGYNKFTDTYVAKGAAAQKATDDKVIAKLQAQVAQDAKDLATSKGQTKAAQASLALYVTQYNQYVAETKANQAKLLAEQQAALAKLNSKLGILNKQLQNAQTELTNAIPTYLPPGSSATCQLSRGLLQIYNASLTGTDSSGGFTTALGLDTDAYDASGVSCSTFAGYLVDNGLAAYSNRQLVIQWQSWYNDNKALIDAAIAAQQATPVPTTAAKKPTATTAAPAPSAGTTSTTSTPTSAPATTPATGAPSSPTPQAVPAGQGK